MALILIFWISSILKKNYSWRFMLMQMSIKLEQTLLFHRLSTFLLLEFIYIYLTKTSSYSFIAIHSWTLSQHIGSEAARTPPPKKTDIENLNVRWETRTESELCIEQFSLWCRTYRIHMLRPGTNVLWGLLQIASLSNFLVRQVYLELCLWLILSSHCESPH